MISALLISIVNTSVVDFNIKVKDVYKHEFGGYTITANTEKDKIKFICNWCFDEKTFKDIKKGEALRVKAKIQGRYTKTYYLMQLKRNKTILFDRTQLGKTSF